MGFCPLSALPSGQPPDACLEGNTTSDLQLTTGSGLQAGGVPVAGRGRLLPGLALRDTRGCVCGWTGG